MGKNKEIHITHVLFPWENFCEQAERENHEKKNGGTRWTDEFCKTVRTNVLRYSELEDIALRSASLYEVYVLVPFHLRSEIFAGVSLPVWI